jgi:hypothetical protein
LAPFSGSRFPWTIDREQSPVMLPLSGTIEHHQGGDPCAAEERQNDDGNLCLGIMFTAAKTVILASGMPSRILPISNCET